MDFENLFSEFPNPDEEKNEPSTDDGLREELISLAEKGEIDYSPKYIQKANRDALEKIKRKYDRKQLESTNEFFSDMIISNYTEILNHFKIIRNPVKLEEN